MDETIVIPELKQIVGALIFASKEPISIAHMRKVIIGTAEQEGGYTKDFAAVTEDQIKQALEELRTLLKTQHVGIQIREVAHGYRLANDPACGPWLRMLLEKGKANRLSRPALETLAIVAYRQPVVRSEIEAVRGVAVDQILRNLLDMQLVRVLGRSELPGRPWMFGTTQKFLEHFGLKSLNDLPGTEELRRLEAEQLKKKEETKSEQQDLIESEPDNSSLPPHTPEEEMSGVPGEDEDEDEFDEDDDDEAWEDEEDSMDDEDKDKELS
jgi:segregation and condensation protein B